MSGRWQGGVNPGGVTSVPLRLLPALAIGVTTFLVAPAPAQALGRFTDNDGNIHESSIEPVAVARITLGFNPLTNSPTRLISVRVR